MWIWVFYSSVMLHSFALWIESSLFHEYIGFGLKAVAFMNT